MAQAFKAYIIIDEPMQPGYPAHPIAPGGPPPEVWPGPGYPAHPIAPGGQPPGFWGGSPAWPSHPIYPGGPPPGPSQGPGFPTHPIVLPPPPQPGQPPEIWPKPGQPAHPIVIPPDAVSPGVPSQPIYLPPVVWPGPGYPAHPIAPGGQPPGPSQGPGFPTPPIYIPLPPGESFPPDGDGNSPTHPIVLPPADPNGDNNVLAHVYIAGHGGCWFLVSTAQVGGQPPQPGPKK
jgi:hypothetical protein